MFYNRRSYQPAANLKIDLFINKDMLMNTMYGLFYPIYMDLSMHVLAGYVTDQKMFNLQFIELNPDAVNVHTKMSQPVLNNPFRESNTTVYQDRMLPVQQMNPMRDNPVNNYYPNQNIPEKNTHIDIEEAVIVKKVNRDYIIKKARETNLGFGLFFEHYDSNIEIESEIMNAVIKLISKGDTDIAINVVFTNYIL